MILRNRLTGQVIEVEWDALSKSQYRRWLACRALELWARSRPGAAVYFLTVTVSDSNLDTENKTVVGLLQFMRERFRRALDGKQAVGDSPSSPLFMESWWQQARAGIDWKYVWVLEVQPKRYRRTGKAAPHWHIAIGCPDGALPDVEYVKSAHYHYKVRQDGWLIGWQELVKQWGRGQVFCMRSYSEHGVLGYLRKYLQKEEDVKLYNPLWASLHRFGSSRFGVLAYPKWARDAAVVRLNGVASEDGLAEGDELAEFDQLWMRRSGGKLNWMAKELDPYDRPGVKDKLVRMVTDRSPWKMEGGW